MIAGKRSTLSLAALAMVAIVLHFGVVGYSQYKVLGFALCLLGVLAFRLTGALHAALLFALAGLFSVLPVLRDSIGQLPVLPLLVPLIISTLILLPSVSGRASIDWLHWGKIDRFSALFILLTGIGSAAALVVWAIWTDNLGIGEQMMRGAMNAPLWVVVLVGLPLFALMNAITEEAVFRGVFQSGIRRTGVPFLWANLVQAAAFAALHFEFGFPNGVIGYAMVFGYGLILGWLRQRTGGLGAPIITHILADLVIGFVMLRMVLSPLGEMSILISS